MRYLMSTLLLIGLFSGWTKNSHSGELGFDQYLELATQNSDSAIYFLRKASEEVTSGLQRAVLNNHLATYYIGQRDFDAASSALFDNLELYTNLYDVPEGLRTVLARSLLKKDLIHKMKGEFQLGNQELGKAMTLIARRRDTTVQLVDIMVNTGENYRMLKDYYEAKKWLMKSLTCAKRINYAEGIVSANNALGNIYETIDVKVAEQYYLACLKTINDYALPEADGIYMNIGLVYKQQLKFSKALEYFRKSESLLKGTNDLTSVMLMGNTYNNTANIFLELTSYDSAIYFYQKALENFDRSLGESHPYKIYPRRGLIAAYPNSTFDLDIQSIIREVLQLSHLHPGQLSTTYSYLGDYYLEENLLNTALTYYDSVITVSAFSVKDKTRYLNHDQVINALNGILKIETIYGNPSLDSLDVLYGQFMAILQDVQRNFDIQIYIENASDALGKLYGLYFAAYEKENSDVILDKLWTISQVNKGIKLKNQLRKKFRDDIHPQVELFKEERQLQDSINMLLNKSRTARIDGILFDLERRNTLLMKKLKQYYPDYYDLKYEDNIQTLKQIQGQLSDQELLLNFLQGREQVYMVKVGKELVDFAEIPKQEFSYLIDSMNQAIFDRDEVVIREISEKIKRLCLIDNLYEVQINHLKIIPDGIIWKLNFAALSDYNEKTYLGNLLKLSYGYFSHKSVYDTKSVSDKVLAFSYNDQASNSDAGAYTLLRNLEESLPGTSTEVMSIAKFWDGSYFYGEAANESVFKQRQDNYSILHLAVHGIEDEHNPENSYLKFAQSDSLNDGRLYAYELYNMESQIDLAVLTACNSGAGKLVTGEGMMSLGHAFMYSGAKSVLASRWAVPDISAPYLMKYFYQGLKEGMKKSAALKYAQNQYLENDADNLTSSPFYWSGFYIVGDDQPLQQNRGRSSIFIFLMVAIMAWLLFSIRKIIR